MARWWWERRREERGGDWRGGGLKRESRREAARGGREDAAAAADAVAAAASLSLSRFISAVFVYNKNIYYLFIWVSILVLFKFVFERFFWIILWRGEKTCGLCRVND